MAWIDDRIWCHPKFTDLTPEAFSTYVRGIAYASGMSTRGHLTNRQQLMVGGTAKVRNELVRAGLWDVKGTSEILIHDWDEHNAKRDARKAADRERKRLARAKERETSPGTSAGQSNGTSAGTAHVDRVKEVKEVKEEPTPDPAVDVTDPEERERVLKGEGVLNTL